MSCAILAWSAVSALGPSADALAPALGEPARSAVALDPDLAAAGLARPRAARADVAPLGGGATDGGDRAARLLGRAARDLAAALDDALPRWRSARLGLALGTSSGGMESMQRAFGRHAAGGTLTPAGARGATYFGPLASGLGEAGIDPSRAHRSTQILAACAASTMAIGLGDRWLARGAVDLVIAGGYDALTVLVAAGFEALRATTASTPAPFQAARDGMALGEGAGLVALVRADAVEARRARAFVLGFGASTDAVHVTAPDRSGAGLARAARGALADAGLRPADVAFVSAHATATPFNDAMEARALADALLGESPPVQALKAQIGHTLGAAGVLETIAAAISLERGVLPPTVVLGPLDPACDVRLLARGEPLPLPSDEAAARGAPAALKLSAAFGGSNAALAIGGRPTAPRRRPVHAAVVTREARVSGADEAREALARAGVGLDRLSRLDPLSLLACGAVAALAGGALAGAGIVAGHALATVDVDARFYARIVARGGAAGEPRLFPATSPNVCAGHAAILFGLTGPSAAVCGGLDGGTEALALAAEWIAAGDAERVVVVAVDDVGEVGRAIFEAAFPGVAVPACGAVAALVERGEARSPRGVPLDLAPSHAGPRAGHEALLDRLRALG